MAKTFNCPICGPVLEVRVHGDWVNPESKDFSFIMTREDDGTYTAKITEETLPLLTDRSERPRLEGHVEQWAEDYTKKVICGKCGVSLNMPKKKAVAEPDPTVAQAGAALTPGNMAGGFMQALGGGAPIPPSVMMMPGTTNTSPSAVIESMFDSKFTEQELDEIITDMGEDPTQFPDKAEKITFLLENMYAD